MTQEQIARADLTRRIRRLRKMRHLTQKQLAELAGVSETTISLVERGADVYLSTYVKVAVALEIPVAESPKV